MEKNIVADPIVVGSVITDLAPGCTFQLEVHPTATDLYYHLMTKLDNGDLRPVPRGLMHNTKANAF